MGGISQDYVHARQWYEKAISLGESGAMVNLGNIYLAGLGVPRDYAQALQLYQRAANAHQIKRDDRIGQP